MTDPHAAAPAHGGHDIAELDARKKKYLRILLWLTLFTVVEVGAALGLRAHLALMWTLLSVFAFWKAALVAMFYMHLKFERRTLCLVLTAPIVFAAILFLALMPDSARLWIS